MRTITNQVSWHYVSSPAEEDIGFLQQELHLPEPVTRELKTLSSRQKFEVYPDLLYIVIKFPIYETRKKTCKSVEIDFIVSKTAVATVTYENVQPLEEFFTQCEQLDGLRQKIFQDTTAELMEAIMTNVFTYGMRELTHIDKSIDEISDHLYEGKERDMIRLISLAKRDTLDFRRILKPTGSIVRAFRDASGALYGREKFFLFNDTLGAYEDTFEVVENQKDTIESLETTNQALLSSKINEVMKILSIMAFLLAPFTIIGSLFQMNTQFAPLIGVPGDWWIILVMILTGCATLFVYFKKKGWL